MDSPFSFRRCINKWYPWGSRLYDAYYNIYNIVFIEEWLIEPWTLLHWRQLSIIQRKTSRNNIVSLNAIRLTKTHHSHRFLIYNHPHHTKLQVIQWNLYIVSTTKTEKRCPLIFLKADPLEAEISRFSLILIAGTYRKKETKENRLKKRSKSYHHNINMYLFNKMLWKS